MYKEITNIKWIPIKYEHYFLSIIYEVTNNIIYILSELINLSRDH